jgi:hypothetical protein
MHSTKLVWTVAARSLSWNLAASASRGEARAQPAGLVKPLARAWRWQRMLDEASTRRSVRSATPRTSRRAMSAGSYDSRCWHPTSSRRSSRGEGSGANAGETGAAAAGELGGAAAVAQRTHVLKNGRPSVRDALHAGVEVDSTKHGLQRRGRRRYILYFLVSAFLAPGFGLAGALGALPADARIFFLSALGFLASRLLLF